MDPLSLISVAPMLLGQCALGLPVILVWVAAGVLVAMRLENNRRAASLALGGIALAIIGQIGSALGSGLTSLLFRSESVQAVGAIYSAFGIVTAIVRAVAWGLVLAGLVIALGKRDRSDEGIA